MINISKTVFIALSFITLFLSISFFAGNYASADITVYGNIVQREHIPIAGAKLSFYSDSGDTVTSYTDKKGNYSAVLNQETSVDAENLQGIILRQNYPNPFNPSTTIEFILNRPSDIQLDIYNILGQKVRILTKGYKSAGNHLYRWDGADDNGKAVSAGIYIYTLHADGFTQSGRMTLSDGSPSGVSSHSAKITHTSKNSGNNYSVIIEKDGFETYIENKFSLNELFERKDFKMTPHDLFPIENGNNWKFMQSDSDSFDYLTGTPSIKIDGISKIGGQDYFLMVQGWNKTLPDSMLVRREKEKIYRLINGANWVIYDFASPIGSSWNFPLSITSENDTVWVKVKKLDNTKIYEKNTDISAFFRFTVEKTGNIWYEIYWLNRGPDKFRYFNTASGIWTVGILENFQALGSGYCLDYDFPSLINFLKEIFEDL
jgi:hypothetical protein